MTCEACTHVFAWAILRKPLGRHVSPARTVPSWKSQQTAGSEMIHKLGETRSGRCYVKNCQKFFSLPSQKGQNHKPISNLPMCYSFPMMTTSPKIACFLHQPNLKDLLPQARYSAVNQHRHTILMEFIRKDWDFSWRFVGLPPHLAHHPLDAQGDDILRRFWTHGSSLGGNLRRKNLSPGGRSPKGRKASSYPVKC